MANTRTFGHVSTAPARPRRRAAPARLIPRASRNRGQARAANATEQPGTQHRRRDVAPKRETPRDLANRIQVSFRGSVSGRADALVQLCRIESDAAFASVLNRPQRSDRGANGSSGNTVFDALPETHEVTPADALMPDSKLGADQRREATKLVAGVLRWRRQLNHVLQSLNTSSRRLKLETCVMLILHIAVYELVFEELPAHAINEHVELTALAGYSRAKSLVNAILRRLVKLRSAGTVPLAELPHGGDVKLMTRSEKDNFAEAMAVATSLPTWLIKRWLKQGGRKRTLRLCERSNAAPTYSAWVNPLRTDRGDMLRTLQRLSTSRFMALALEESKLLPEFLRIPPGGLQTVIADGALERGDVTVQDEAAGLVVSLLDPQPGDTVLDACAAPGGKTLLAAVRMRAAAVRDTGQAPPAAASIVAMDINGRRLGLLRRRATAVGVEDMIILRTGDLASDVCSRGLMCEHLSRRTGARAQESQIPAERFSKVLLDAPCSGTGVLAKRADLRWRLTPDKIRELATLQKQLLSAAAQCVEPGGVLVYSTCSLEPDENELQAEWFVANFPDFYLFEGPTQVPPECMKNGMLVCTPVEHDTDGSFAARFVRRM